MEAHTDAPPSYDTVGTVCNHRPAVISTSSSSYTSTSSYPNDIKSPYSPKTSSATQAPLSAASSSARSLPPKASPSWLASFGIQSKKTKEVRWTILSLITQLVREQTHSDLGAILDSCSSAAQASDLNLSDILQEKSIDLHTPIYWAIVTRPANPRPDSHDFVTTLLTRSAPLTASTVSEIKQACLLTSDDTLFQELRQSAILSPPSFVDKLLVGPAISSAPDSITVAIVPGSVVGAFSAHVSITAFQKRMAVSRSITLEFIARSRLWSLSFVAPEAGSRQSSWTISVSLLESSPPTWVDCALIIDSPTADTHKPICLRLSYGTSAQLKPNGHNQFSSKVFAHLHEDTLSNSLHYDGCPYVSSDGTLQARLEVRLQQYKRDDDCIIC